MMKGWLVLPFFLLAFSPQVFAWGQIGHRVTAAIAEQHISKQAADAIHSLLPNESLAEASTYADEMRSNPAEFWQKTASPWHYVTVPAGKRYEQVGSPAQGDAVTALKHFTKVLKDKHAPRADRQLALRFIVHLIGDLHQPLHVGNGTDRGGNSFKVTFMREETNLHSVWDSKLINFKRLSFSELALWLDAKIDKSQVQQWSVIDPLVWVAESGEIRDKIYPAKRSLSYGYIYEQMPVVKRRLQQGGIRLAAYLNEIFDS